MNPESGMNLKDLSARLVRLENRNKLLVRWNFLLIAMVCLMLFVGWKAYDQPSEWVHCRGVAVSDADGRTRAMLTVKANGPIMEFYDATGKVTWTAPTRFRVSPTEK